MQGTLPSFALFLAWPRILLKCVIDVINQQVGEKMIRMLLGVIGLGMLFTFAYALLQTFVNLL